MFSNENKFICELKVASGRIENNKRTNKLTSNTHYHWRRTNGNLR